MAKEKTTLVKAGKAPMKIRKSLPVSADSLISLVIKKNGTIDIALLKELTALKHAEEDRFAMQQYEVHFAVAQAVYPCVKKTKIAKDNEGNKLYAFCPIEDIIPVYGPILTKNGFSWRWDEVQVDEKHIKTICYLSGYGHTKTASKILPIVKGTRANNEIQESAITSSYGKRYTFNSVVGVIIAGEDLDGNPNVNSTEMKTPQAKKKAGGDKDWDREKLALSMCFKRLGASKLFTDIGEKSELAKYKADAEKIVKEGDIEKVKALRKAWESTLTARKIAAKKGKS